MRCLACSEATPHPRSRTWLRPPVPGDEHPCGRHRAERAPVGLIVSLSTHKAEAPEDSGTDIMRRTSKTTGSTTLRQKALVPAEEMLRPAAGVLPEELAP